MKRKKKTKKSIQPKCIQYKFPKKIMIGDVEFEMRYDNKTNGADFSYPYKKDKGYIRLGTSDLKSNPTRFLSILIHELKEIIHIEQSTRFKREDEVTTYEFHYSHKEHTDLCARLAGLLIQFIK